MGAVTGDAVRKVLKEENVISLAIPGNIKAVHSLLPLCSVPDLYFIISRARKTPKVLI